MGSLLVLSLAVVSSLAVLLISTGFVLFRAEIVERGRIGVADVAAASGTAHRALLPNGEERWFEFLGTTYRTLTGDLRIVARVRDVTTRTHEQDDLSRSEARLRRAERIAGVGSWELDPRADRLIFSDELFRIHGLER